MYHTRRLRPYFDEIKIASLERFDELTRIDNEKIAREESIIFLKPTLITSKISLLMMRKLYLQFLLKNSVQLSWHWLMVQRNVCIRMGTILIALYLMTSLQSSLIPQRKYFGMSYLLNDYK